MFNFTLSPPPSLSHPSHVLSSLGHCYINPLHSRVTVSALCFFASFPPCALKEKCRPFVAKTYAEDFELGRPVLNNFTYDIIAWWVAARNAYQQLDDIVVVYVLLDILSPSSQILLLLVLVPKMRLIMFHLFLLNAQFCEPLNLCDRNAWSSLTTWYDLQYLQ